MPVTADKPGPYTSPTPVIDLIERHRTRGLPAIIDSDVLGRAGVAQSLIPRTLQSLTALDLIDEKGQITDFLEGIRKAPETEYKARVADWLNSVYADVLTYADPATDDETKIRDAFRNYKPYGQQDRMVTLFRQLYAFAGIQGKSDVVAPRARVNPAPRVRAQQLPRDTRQERKPPDTGGDAGAIPPGLNPALAGLLATLPKNGDGWTEQQRNKFYTTFGAVLDFCFPTVTDTSAKTETAGE